MIDLILSIFNFIRFLKDLKIIQFLFFKDDNILIFENIAPKIDYKI